jgi:hypothetical protein
MGGKTPQFGFDALYLPGLTPTIFRVLLGVDSMA